MNTEVFNMFRYIKINKYRSELSTFTHSKITSLVLSTDMDPRITKP